MFCSVSLDCSRPAETIYSHFIQPEKVLNSSGVLVDNPAFVYFRAPEQARFIVDQGYNGFNIVLPIRTRIGSKDFQFCPTGTQAIRKWYNNAFNRSQTTPGYKNDGNWRFTNSFSWRDAPPLRGYESAYDDEMFCGPAQAKAIWVNNDLPNDRQQQADGLVRGSFVSRFEISTGARASYNTIDVSRSASFDQSRKMYFAPGEDFRRTLQINALTNAINPIDANFSGNRIASLVDERTGHVLQLDTYLSGNRVWVLNRLQPVDATPQLFIAPFTPSISLDNRFIEAAVAGRIENDVFFRVLAVNQFSAARVEAWDLRTGNRIVSYPLNVQVAVDAEPDSFRPEISYNPSSNRLYVTSVVAGRLFYVDLDNGDAREIVLPNINFGVRDIEVDSARNVAYLAFRATAGGRLAANDVSNARSRIYELNLATNSLARQVDVGIAAWQMALVPVNNILNIFVTNAADGAENNGDDSVSQVSVLNFTQVRKLTTLNQPVAINVQLLD
jgi:hypothetical protein